MKLVKLDADVPEGHAFQERRDLHPTDIKLRKQGFRIRHRRRGEEPVWERGGELFAQSRALEVVEKGG